jgi:Ca2+-binding EF-hand superfamily protein
MGAKLEEVFKLFDTDGSGSLDASELKAAFAAAGRPADDETIRKSIAALDENNDGVISLDEFKAIAWKNATSSG